MKTFLNSSLSKPILAFASAVFLQAGAGSAYAQVALPYADLHDFGGKSIDAAGQTGSDGAFPQGSVTFDSAGNMYGTTTHDGAVGQNIPVGGTVWEITKEGVYKDLHDFLVAPITYPDGTTGRDAAQPESAITMDKAGNLYGTASDEGRYHWGNVWEITASGTYKDLYDFGAPTITYSDGTTGINSPYVVAGAGVSVDTAGNLYGTTDFGGEYNGGLLWKLSPTGAFTDLHDFGGTVTYADGTSGTDGIGPSAVSIDSLGDLFGTTYREGGEGGYGNIWEFTLSGKYKDLYDWAPGVYGPYADGGATVDSSGNLYGTTQDGNGGSIWELPKGGSYKTLHEFGGTIDYANGGTGPDGSTPDAAVTIDESGNLYGTTSQGGAYGESNLGSGNVWEITKAGVYYDLHDFGGTINYSSGSTGVDGANPGGGVTLDANGNLWGTAAYGGLYGANINEQFAGMIWKITTIHGFFLSVNTVAGGSGAIGTVTLNGPAPIGGATLELSSSNSFATVPSSLTIPQGATSGTFTIKTKTVVSETRPTITAQAGPDIEKATLTVLPLAVSALSLAPTTVVGGESATGTVTLNGPAPVGGVKIDFGTTNSKIAAPPASVTVAAGSASAQFAIKTYNDTTGTAVTIRATYNGSSQSAQHTVDPIDAITALSFNPATVTGGTPSTGTITLKNPAPSGGVTVTFGTTNSKVANAPSSLTIPQGSTSATFKLTTYAVGSATTVTIRAVIGTSSQSAQVTVNP